MMSLNDFFELIDRATNSWITRTLLIGAFGLACMVAASDTLHPWGLIIPAVLLLIIVLSEWRSSETKTKELSNHDLGLLKNINNEIKNIDIAYISKHDFLSSFHGDKTDRIALFYHKFPIDDERFIFNDEKLNKSWKDLHNSMSDFYETLSVNTNIIPHNNEVATVKRDEPWTEEMQRQEITSAELINKAADVMKNRWNAFHSTVRKLSS